MPLFARVHLIITTVWTYPGFMKDSSIFRYHTHLFLGLVLLLTTVPFAKAGGNGAALVDVAEVVEVNLSPVIWLPGTVISRFDSEIAAEVDGRIELIHDIGTHVEKGDVLVRLDDDIIRLELEAAKAEIPPIKSRLDYLGRETQRLEKLAKQNNAAKSLLDETQSRRDEAAGQLEINKARFSMAQTRLDKTVIRAPFSGVISERYKTEGEWASEGDDILKLVNTDLLEIQARIPVRNIDYIKRGDELTATTGERDIRAKVSTIVPVGDIRSRLYEIRMSLEEDEWMAGQALKIAIPDSKPRTVTAVPSDALVIRQEKISVFLIRDGVAEEVFVKTGMSNNGLIEIKGEIEPGDIIVIRGNERLRNGQKVIIRKG